MKESSCVLEKITWIIKPRSIEEKQYLWNKYLKPAPMIQRRGKWFKIYNFCKIGNSYWGYIKPDLEELLELERILFGRNDIMGNFYRETIPSLEEQ